MWSALLLAPLNHLLRQQTWAARRLAAFSGEQGRFCLGGTADGSSSPLSVRFQIADDGLLGEAVGEAYGVEVIVSSEALCALTAGPQAVLASAHVRGRADLAEAIREVFRHLRPDLEDDLARLIGDIPAHRLSRFIGTRAGRLQCDVGALLQGVRENLQYEAQVLPCRADLERFRADTLTLQQATDGLLSRLRRLDNAA
jgi:ubiquinone biosynthesis accessory factor UbiJ